MSQIDGDNNSILQVTVGGFFVVFLVIQETFLKRLVRRGHNGIQFPLMCGVSLRYLHMRDTMNLIWRRNHESDSQRCTLQMI